MKGLLTIGTIILLTSSVICRGAERNCPDKGQENKVTMDIISCISAGTVRFGFGHRLDSRWSIEGKVGIRLLSGKKTDTETLVHWKDVGRDYLKNRAAGYREDLLRSSIDIQYWPSSTYKGIFISIGAEIHDRGHPDGTIGLGYVFKIWKNLHSDISFRTGLIKAVQTQKISPDGLEIGISYIF